MSKLAAAVQTPTGTAYRVDRQHQRPTPSVWLTVPVCVSGGNVGSTPSSSQGRTRSIVGGLSRRHAPGRRRGPVRAAPLPPDTRRSRRRAPPPPPPPAPPPRPGPP